MQTNLTFDLTFSLAYAPVQGSIEFAHACQLRYNNEVIISMASSANSFNSLFLLKGWFIFSLKGVY